MKKIGNGIVLNERNQVTCDQVNTKSEINAQKIYLLNENKARKTERKIEKMHFHVLKTFTSVPNTEWKNISK